MSQMIFSGSRAATSVTKSHSPFSMTSSTMTVAARCTSSSNFLIIRGVKPAETIRRSRAWRGSSMLIIEPKNSRNGGGMSKRLVAPAPEQNTSGLRLISTMSA